jgi:hypothetical protein
VARPPSWCKLAFLHPPSEEQIHRTKGTKLQSSSSSSSENKANKIMDRYPKKPRREYQQPQPHRNNRNPPPGRGRGRGRGRGQGCGQGRGNPNQNRKNGKDFIGGWDPDPPSPWGDYYCHPRHERGGRGTGRERGCRGHQPQQGGYRRDSTIRPQPQPRPSPRSIEHQKSAVSLPQQVVEDWSQASNFEAFLAKPIDERLAFFDAMPEDQKLLLLYPQKITTGLPPRDPYPKNWEVMLTRASNVAKTKIQASFRKQQPPASTTTGTPQAPTRSRDLEFDTDSGRSDNEDDDLYEGQVVRTMTQGSSTTNNISQISTAERNQLLFLEHLPRCLPIITYGFHVDKHNRDTKDSFCFCPCDRNTPQGTVAGRWRLICGMENIMSENICSSPKKKVIQMKPQAFLNHLESKVNSCGFHRILYDFLDELFSEFNGLDDDNKHAKHNKHISFLDVNGDDWNLAMREIRKKDERLESLVAEKIRTLEEDVCKLRRVSSQGRNCIWSMILVLSTDKLDFNTGRRNAH